MNTNPSDYWWYKLPERENYISYISGYTVFIQKKEQSYIYRVQYGRKLEDGGLADSLLEAKQLSLILVKQLEDSNANPYHP